MPGESDWKPLSIQNIFEPSTLHYIRCGLVKMASWIRFSIVEQKIWVVTLFSSFIRHPEWAGYSGFISMCQRLCTGVPILAPVPEVSDAWYHGWLLQVFLCPSRTVVLRLWSVWRRPSSCLLSLLVRWLTWAPRSRTPPSTRWKCRPRSRRRTSSQVTRPFNINVKINHVIPSNKCICGDL